MRQQYPDIIPGYYSNKQHWNSVKPDGEIPDDLLKHWLDSKHRFTNCASCDQLPCEIWQVTRDPSMTDEQFRKSIDDRVSALKSYGLT